MDMSKTAYNMDATQNVIHIPLGTPDPNLSPSIELGIPIVENRAPVKNIVAQIYSSQMKGTHVFLLDANRLPIDSLKDEKSTITPPEWAYWLHRQLFLFWKVEDPLRSMTDNTSHYVIMAQFVLPTEWRAGDVFQPVTVERIDVTSDYAYIDEVKCMPTADNAYKVGVTVSGPELFFDKILEQVATIWGDERIDAHVDNVESEPGVMSGLFTQSRKDGEVPYFS
jgi:hypothetical protein